MLKSKISGFRSDFSRAAPEQKLLSLKTHLSASGSLYQCKMQVPQTGRWQRKEEMERGAVTPHPPPKERAPAKPGCNLSGSSQHPAPRSLPRLLQDRDTAAPGDIHISLGRDGQPAPYPNCISLLPQNIRLCISEAVTTQVRGEASCFP